MHNIYNDNGIATNGLVLLLDASSTASYNGATTPSSGTLWRDISGAGNNATFAAAGTTPWPSLGGSGQAKYFSFIKDLNVPARNYVKVGNFVSYQTFTIVFQPDFTLNNTGGLTYLIGSGYGDVSLGYTSGGIRAYNVNGVGPWLLNGNPAKPQDWVYNASLTTNNPVPTWYNNNSINYGNGLGTQVSQGYAFSSGWNILTVVRTNVGPPTAPQLPTSFQLYIAAGGTPDPINSNFAGKIAYIAGYNRKLTNAEQIQNFTTLRNRFNPTMI